MKNQVLISGASIAGLTLAYWLNRYGYQVTLIEITKGLRRGGSPIDVRGDALNVAEKMGILGKIKAKELIHTDEIVNAKNETLVNFAINAQAEYHGDIEIHRDDLVDILFENIPANEVEFLFESRIEKLIQHEDKVEVTLKGAGSRNFDFVFGADGTHSTVRKLVFGDEENYSKFFGAYFAFVEAPNIKPNKPNSGVLYQEPGKMAALYPFKKTVNALLVFRSPKLDWDYRNDEQHKQILKDNFKNNSWKIPEILDTMLHSDNLYFDEVCQIHMPTWSKGRVAVVGDAAHTTSFPTGMGTSLAMQGASILAQELQASKGDYKSAFSKYYESYKPFVESIQARIVRGLNFSVPETEEGIQETIKRFKQEAIDEPTQEIH
ncbi:2-polyprenyl-6-methoxyphenol hydroxylase [Mucilaginibacter lappiensis]|uniref:2-polyprenyl-6-methoxyphenol hydroxylase-like FAD-dependent oxidoreductase n=1 Tax=Mucilaginibacter lappiensis TaxID=354630 RepID=A0ABR6PRL8_9SPHI|nr:FAD-dependent monooxygenase [Mucilaginibacter lappiensis]MBB6112428.1 2-polyprenyl-6-methoxyphenol hydroxylase-like FAD-dependent oxidoreductase [Mucilaginibacter lappiensis]SIS00544.1 2-polyprenyl-6-methoxyphenol hydroxylase [Mucilaginibacter lappiensis]